MNLFNWRLPMRSRLSADAGDILCGRAHTYWENDPRPFRRSAFAVALQAPNFGQIFGRLAPKRRLAFEIIANSRRKIGVARHPATNQLKDSLPAAEEGRKRAETVPTQVMRAVRLVPEIVVFVSLVAQRAIKIDEEWRAEDKAIADAARVRCRSRTEALPTPACALFNPRDQLPVAQLISSGRDRLSGARSDRRPCARPRWCAGRGR